MELINLKDFFASYSLPTIIIAVVVVIICFLVNFFTKNKFNAILRAQLPFILSLVIYIIYDMIVKKAFVISDDGIYVGILCGSLAGIINSIVNRFLQGKTIFLSPSALLIENILSNYFSDKSITDTAKKIDNIMVNHMADCDKTIAIDSISQTLKESNGNFPSTDEIARIALLIYDAVRRLSDS